MNSTSPMIKKFYEVLFDPGQTTCFSENAFGTSVYHIDDIQNTYPDYKKLMYFSVNALHTHRFDDNVTCFRNFILENDRIESIKDQIEVVKNIGMPYSVATFSGGKSVHFIISMETPAPDRSKYDFVANWIHNIVNDKLPPDKAFDCKTKNPSRFTRVPGGTNIKRDEAGNIIRCKEQTLLRVNGRIPEDVMADWLLSHPHCKPVIKKYDAIVANDTFNPLLLKKWSTYLLDSGIHIGKRSDSFYEMGCDFIQAGASLDEAIKYVHDNAKHLGDFPFKEVESAIKSAYRKFERDRNVTTRSDN